MLEYIGGVGRSPGLSCFEKCRWRLAGPERDPFGRHFSDFWAMTVLFTGEL